MHPMSQTLVRIATTAGRASQIYRFANLMGARLGHDVNITFWAPDDHEEDGEACQCPIEVGINHRILAVLSLAECAELLHYLILGHPFSLHRCCLLVFVRWKHVLHRRLACMCHGRTVHETLSVGFKGSAALGRPSLAANTLSTLLSEGKWPVNCRGV